MFPDCRQSIDGASEVFIHSVSGRALPGGALSAKRAAGRQHQQQAAAAFAKRTRRTPHLPEPPGNVRVCPAARPHSHPADVQPKSRGAAGLSMRVRAASPARFTSARRPIEGEEDSDLRHDVGGGAWPEGAEPETGAFRRAIYFASLPRGVVRKGAGARIEYRLRANGEQFVIVWRGG